MSFCPIARYPSRYGYLVLGRNEEITKVQFERTELLYYLPNTGYLICEMIYD